MADVSAPSPEVEPAPPGPIAPLPRDPRADAWAAEHPEWTAPPTEGDGPGVASTPVTVLVPTLNEEADLPACLQRLRWAEQVIVLDSGSTDQTMPIAQALGAEVIRFDYARHAPTGWPKKRNWALDHAPIRHDWVLLNDADELVPAALARQVADVVTGAALPKNPGDGRAFWINRRFVFHGRWVRFGGYYPAWNLRLFRKDLGRFERLTTVGDTRSGDMEVHEHVKLAPEAGEAGFLDFDLEHREIADFAEWVEKHNRYSSWEAAVARQGLDDGIPARFFGTPQQRRRWLKRAARRLPLRPTLRFWYHFGLRQGFREGRLGLHLARMLAAYEAMTLAKIDEPDQSLSIKKHPTPAGRGVGRNRGPDGLL
jgi:glycosyltransferase involved in cell wall biosynthesis